MKRWPCILIALLIGFSSTLVKGQVLENAEEAFQQSASSNKPLLMIFAGSDWCAPCIRLNDKVLTQGAFIDYAKDHLILLKIDFPQRKKLSKENRKTNEGLAEKYNPKGQFPHVLLLNPDRSVLGSLIYKNQTPEQFISEIRPYFAE